MARIITLLFCTFLILPNSIQASSSHRPYEWKFTCYPIKTVDADYNVVFDATLKREYSNPDFLSLIERNMGYSGCFEGVSLGDYIGRWKAKREELDDKPYDTEAVAKYYTRPFLKVLEADYTYASQQFERWGFNPPNRVRTTARLDAVSREVNILFLGREKGYMATHGCSPSTTKTMAAAISISGQTHEIWKASQNKPFLLMSVLHELGHVHQADRFGFLLQGHCGSVHQWIGEGIPDSWAVMGANAETGKDYHAPYANIYAKRFFLVRPYYIPLNLQPVNEQYSYTAAKLLGYRTNGFWEFFSRRYLHSQLSRYENLHDNFTKKDLSNQTKKIDQWLDQYDGNASQGLEHVYPQFLAALNTWPAHRFQNKMSQAKWEGIAFEGCKQVIVSPNQSQTLSVELDRYAGRCLEVSLTGFQASNIAEASLHIEALGTQAAVDELYLAWSETKGSNNADGDCYKALDKQGAKSNPCLLSPTQGQSPLHPKAQIGRYWSTDKLVFNGSNDIKVKLILSRIPTQHLDIGSQEDKQTLQFNLGASYATLKQNGSNKNASVGAGRISASAGGMHAPVPIKGKNISMMPMNMMSEAALGRMGIEFPDGMAHADQVAEKIYGLSRLEISPAMVGDGMGDIPNEGLMLLMRNPPTFGQVGKVPVMAVYQHNNQDLLILQNPKEDSYLNISRYDRISLNFDGTAHLCKVSIAKLTQAAMGGGKNLDLCKVGEPVEMSFSGNMAFGALAIGTQAMKEMRSVSYDAYRELRTARINAKFKAITPEKPSDKPTTTDNPDNKDTLSVDMNLNKDGCDCSCDALKKLEAMEEKDVTPANMAMMIKMSQCAMTCMADYAKCDI